MKFFVSFLWVTSVLAIYTMVISIIYLVWNIVWVDESLEKLREYAWMGCSALPLIAIGIWGVMTNGIRMHVLLLPGIIGFGLMTLYMGIVIGFEGVIRTPVPFFIAAVSAFYVPWYSLV